MKRIIALIVFAFICAMATEAQVPVREVISSTSDPTGSNCVLSKVYVNTTSPGKVWVRIGGVCTRIDGIGAGAAWGDITGTLADQTDLQTALNLKAPLASPTFTGTVTTPVLTATTSSSLGVASATSLTVAENISTPGSISTGVGGTVAGTLELTQGTAPSLGTTSIKMYAPVSVTSYSIVRAGAAATGIPHFSNSANIITETISAINLASADVTGILPVANGGTGTTELFYSAGAPSIAGNATLNSGSKDSAGKITSTGTGASTAVITFSITFIRAPSCFVTNETTSNLVRPVSTTTTLTVNATVVTGDSLSYVCLAY